MNITKRGVAALVCGLVLFSLSITSPAQADGLGGISGFEPAPNVCGTASLTPVVVTNATNITQTLTIKTTAGGMAEQVTFLTSASQFNGECPQRDGTGVAGQNADAWTQTVSVSPGTSESFYLSLGGVDYNLLTGGNTFAFNGGASIYGITSGVIAQLNLGADEQFKSLSTSYEFLGPNMLPGFNLFECNTVPNAAGGTDIFTTATMLTPYAAVTTAGPTYDSGQPMCMGWIPPGTYVEPSLSSIPGATVLAVVTNVSGLPVGQNYDGAADASPPVLTSAAILLPSGFGEVTAVYLDSFNRTNAEINETVFDLSGTASDYSKYLYPFNQMEDILILQTFPVACGGNIGVVIVGSSGQWVEGTIGIGTNSLSTCSTQS